MYGKCCLLILHGSGGNGGEIREFLDEYPIEHQNWQTFHQLMNGINCDIHSPSSKVIRYSPAGGERMNVWFDRSPRFQREGLDSEEDSDGATQSIQTLASYLVEIEGKYHYDHYFLGGFSMGGGCCLHFLRSGMLPPLIAKKVRGMFTLGSFLVQNSAVMKADLHPRAKELPILMLHGENDSLIPCDWGRKTAANLLVRELNIEFRSYPGVDHEMGPAELSDLYSWIVEVLKDYYTVTGANDGKMELEDEDIERYERYTKAKADKIESKYNDLSDQMYHNSKDYTGYSAGTSSAPSSSQPTSTARSTQSGKQRSTAEIQEHVKGDISHLPYSVEYIDVKSQGGESKMAMVAPKVLIRFDCPAEYVGLLVSRPILACGSMFEIQEDQPYGVKTELFSSDPHSTAMEISKRLFNRIHSGSASLNPCQQS